MACVGSYYNQYMKNYALFVVLMVFGLSTVVSAQEMSEISYAVTGGIFDSVFEATIDGKSHVVADLPECLQLEDVQDFDGDGYLDALVSDVIACGGNGVGNRHFFVYYDGENFHATETFGYSWAAPVVEPWQGTITVYTVSDNVGLNNEDEQIIRERHILRDGQAVQVWMEESEEIEALLELRSSAFNLLDYDPDATLAMTFDFDDDGQGETMTCSFWQRWGTLDCNVALKGKALNISSCRRVGVLASMHNGVHDIVCGDETVYSWTGESYQALEN